MTVLVYIHLYVRKVTHFSASVKFDLYGKFNGTDYEDALLCMLTSKEFLAIGNNVTTLASLILYKI